MSDGESEAEEVSDLSSPDVTTKYRTAGDIVNKVLGKVIEACTPEADIGTLCEMGDKLLEEETGKLYNKKEKGKKIEKGIAFPTCISVNELIGHYSPLPGESRQLQAGDVAKIDMACHIDGFIAAAAHTVVIGGEKAEDRRADVIMAAWTAAEAALRLVQVGNSSTLVTEAFAKVAEEFKCKPVQGVLSHQLKKHVIDGNRAIIGCETADEKVDEFEFEMNEVYCLDVVMSTGEGKGKEAELRHTVYKRNVENNYLLKTQKARQFIHEVNRRFPALPFSLRAIEDVQVARVGVSEAKRHELLDEFPALPFSLRAIEDVQVARVGVSEAKRHELLDEYPVLKEKDKETVAQFKFTALLLPGGTKRITGLPLNEAQVGSELSVQDEGLKKLLATSANPKKAKKKKKEGKDDKPAEEKKDEPADEKQ